VDRDERQRRQRERPEVVERHRAGGSEAGGLHAVDVREDGAHARGVGGRERLAAGLLDEVLDIRRDRGFVDVDVVDDDARIAQLLADLACGTPERSPLWPSETSTMSRSPSFVSATMLRAQKRSAAPIIVPPMWEGWFIGSAKGRASRIACRSFVISSHRTCCTPNMVSPNASPSRACVNSSIAFVASS
jgi:hypothetical protein